MGKRQAWNTILAFIILVFGFTAATLIKPAEEFSETENRVLAQMPEISLSSVLDGSFEAEYEEYLTDQFVLRDGWIGLKTAAERAAQKRESKDIYFAEDGYLIEKHTGVFTSDAADRSIAQLAEFAKKSVAQLGENHVTVMVVPNAVDILRDKLPPLASPYDQEEYLARLQEALPEGIWMDTSSVLREHLDEELYYRTDHHWKTNAAFWVYQAWAERQGYAVPEKAAYQIETVSDNFEGTIQSKLGIRAQKDTIELYLPRKDLFYTVQKNEEQEIGYSVYDYSALNTKDQYAVYFGGNHALVRIGTRAKTGRRILVIKDSYAHCFVPFLLEEFEKIDMLDIRYYNQKLSELLEEGAYTDLLLLYNASGFAQDTSLAKLQS